MSRPLVFGSSHIGPMMKASGEVPFDFKKIVDFAPDHKLARRVEGRIELLAPIAEWLDENPCQDLIVTISGHNYLTLCLTEGDAPYDVVLPWRPDLGPRSDARIVPFAEIHAVLQAELQYVFEGLEALAAWRPPGVHLWWIEAPPPVSDEAFLLEWAAEKGKHWREFLNGKFSSPWLRMKMYLLQRRLTQDCCSRYGIDYIPHPSSVADDDGFLRTDFALDVCHGNRAAARPWIPFWTPFNSPARHPEPVENLTLSR